MISKWKRSDRGGGMPALLQAREEGEYYVPDRLTNEDNEAGPTPVEATWVHREGARCFCP